MNDSFTGACLCGSAFTFYGIWPAGRFEHRGETGEFKGRHFCIRCGSRVFALDAHEAEIKLGTLVQAPTPLVPNYELWVKRRESWLPPVAGATQYDEDRSRTLTQARPALG